MEKEAVKFERQREDMVRKQIEARGVTDPRVLEAMRTVPRHRFVSEALMDQAYGDFPLPIGDKQTISQPFIVAEMTQALQLDEDDRVLEIGTGSGYQAAVLAEIAYRVYTIERIEPLYKKARLLFDDLGYDNITTRLSDGTAGWPEKSPFNAIIVTAGGPAVPRQLIAQLAVGGRMVIPVGNKYCQELTKIHKDQGGIRQSSLGGCRFVKLVGQDGWKEEDH
jgi:protein-L-isoaspartate(D-aspartate) O-methyltransferase